MTAYGHDGAATIPLRMTARCTVRYEQKSSSGFLTASEESPLFEDREDFTLWNPAPGVEVVLPHHYTPSYAYPAIVWLPSENQTERIALEQMKSISERNFVGIGLRSALFSDLAAEQNGASTGMKLRRSLERFRRVLEVIHLQLLLHKQRLYVGATGASAPIALQWLCTQPEWFAGSILIDPVVPQHWELRTSRGGILPHRVLLASGVRHLASAELDVMSLSIKALSGKLTRRDYKLDPDAVSHLGRDINSWILAGIDPAFHAFFPAQKPTDHTCDDPFHQE